MYDTQGNNDVELRLCDDNGCSHGVWSENQTSQSEWNKITWTLSGFTGADIGRGRNIELYEWHDGTYSVILKSGGDQLESLIGETGSPR